MQCSLTRQAATRIAALALVVTAGASLATANSRPSPFLYDARHYGQLNIPLVESTGNAAAYIATHKGAFEPVNELLPEDALRKLSRPVGRIDMLGERQGGERYMGTCTGALLAGNYLLTNHHCFPQGGPNRVLKASIVMDFLSQGGEGSKRYEVTVTPEEFSDELDYAVLKVDGNPTAAFGYVRLSATEAQPGEGMIIFHHPLGRPKMMTRFRCLAMRAQPDAQNLRHRCDTMPGSSGSLILNNRYETVALHYAGGLNPNEDDSFNLATRIGKIVAQSALLKRVIAAQGPTTARPPADTAAKSAEPTAAGGPRPSGSDAATTSVEEMSKNLIK